jgi:hypothetical protein
MNRINRDEGCKPSKVDLGHGGAAEGPFQPQTKDNDIQPLIHLLNSLQHSGDSGRP